MQDHAGFERKSSCVEIIGIVRGKALHCGRVGFVALLPISASAMPTSFREDLNIFALVRWRDGTEVESLLNGLVSFRRRDVHILVHIHVASVGQGHSPVGHGGLRIELRGVAKRTYGFGAIEAKSELQTLIEVFLCFGVFGSYRVIWVPEIGEE